MPSLLTKTSDSLYKTNKYLHRFINVIAGSIIGIMTLCVLLQVFFRYVLNSPLDWSDEVSRFLMIYMSFLLMPVVYMNNQNIQMSILVDLLKGKTSGAILCILIDVVALLFSIAMVYFSYQFTLGGHYIRADVLPIKLTVIYAVMPVGFLLMIPSACICILGRIGYLLSGDKPLFIKNLES